MQKWEYLVVQVRLTVDSRWHPYSANGGAMLFSGDLYAYLNYLGGLGWEMVNGTSVDVPPTEFDPGGPALDFYFKRPTPPS